MYQNVGVALFLFKTQKGEGEIPPIWLLVIALDGSNEFLLYIHGKFNTKCLV